MSIARLKAHMPVRCLVGFYGLNRSLRWTATSISERILKPLRRNNVDFRCLAHFNEPPTINNEHSSEFNIRVNRHGLTDLALDGLIFEAQDEGRLPASTLELLDGLSPSPRLEPRQNMVNLISQLYSLSQLWKLIELTPDKFDMFLFFRPDLEYLDDFESSRVIGEIIGNGVDLVTPCWDRWGGLNDRFAFCSYKGAHAFANRIDQVDRFCAETGYLHAEELLKSVAIWSKLEQGTTPMRAMRVRADGSTIREGFKLSPFAVSRGIARKRIHKLRKMLDFS